VFFFVYRSSREHLFVFVPLLACLFLFVCRFSQMRISIHAQSVPAPSARKPVEFSIELRRVRARCRYYGEAAPGCTIVIVLVCSFESKAR
jgi:hypothetical protein